MIKAITAVFLLGLGVSFFLSLTNNYTQDKITKNKILHQSQILRKLLMDHQIEIPEPADPTASDCSNWIIRKIESPGYSGNIESLGLVQFRKEGAVLSLRIINHSETPGIGDFIDHRKNSWIKKLDNKTKQEWSAIDMVSGATITSKAVRTIAMISFESEGGQCVLLG